MKSRNGFVSNSSSASFVVHWRFRDFGQKIDKFEALRSMYELSGKDGLTALQDGKFAWDDMYEYSQEHKDVVEYLKNFTAENGDGTFTTAFSTSMLNSHEDFGEEAKSFVLGLVTNDKFQIIDSRVDRDIY